jgi:hypothetical protein
VIISLPSGGLWKTLKDSHGIGSTSRTPTGEVGKEFCADLDLMRVMIYDLRDYVC